MVEIFVESIFSVVAGSLFVPFFSASLVENMKLLAATVGLFVTLFPASLHKVFIETILLSPVADD